MTPKYGLDYSGVEPEFLQLLGQCAEGALDGSEFEFGGLGGGEGAGELRQAGSVHRVVEIGGASGGEDAALAVAHLCHRLREDVLAKRLAD